MTTPTTRTPGIAGRRRPRPERLARALRFSQFWTGLLPSHPVQQDNLALLKGGWQMLGNDSAGDCVAVTWANFRRLMSAVLGGREVYPTQDQVWEVYRTQNPDFDPNGTADTNGPGSTADQGMEIQALLEYLVKTGGPDGVKAVAFARVDHTNPNEVDAAIAIFGGLWTGVVVQEAQQEQFSQGQAWDWVAGSPEEGGHSILTGGYTGIGNFKDVTWAAETAYTGRYLARGVEELWLVLWPEHLGTRAFLEGVDQAALSAAYTALTGDPFPVAPQPQPTPVPEPTPGPAPDADAALVQVLKTTGFLSGRHEGGIRKVAVALGAWLQAHDYTF